MQFKELGLSDEILSAVNDVGFEQLTEIQEKSIPMILQGHDVIGRSNTGTGKTAAFGIPVIEQIGKNISGVQVIILCPTRELAQQACDEIKKFSKYKKYVKPLAIFGGVNIDKQIFQLKRGANLIIGTPGRVIDHINRRTLKLSNLRTIILDEADEMLQMGFREDIENILKYVPQERQTILFSATMPPEILAITKEYQNNPVLIKTISKSKTVEAIEQKYYNIPYGKKFDALTLLLVNYNYNSTMIFCNTKKMVDELTEMLTNNNFKAAGIHGDMKQTQRMSVMNAFKSGKISILVATDVAARGIDVSGVDAVFNFDLPQDNEYYIHRIGRTGRAGKNGTAHTLICNKKQLTELRMIARNTRSEITESELPEKAQIINKKMLVYLDELLKNRNDVIYNETYNFINLLKESGYKTEDILIQLINETFSKTVQSIPEVSTIKYNSKSSDRVNIRRSTRKEDISSDIAMVNINLGKKQKINPNYILGALVDATGISGKNFGKINIHDNFTVVEVPENKIDYIIGSMKNGKINGKKVVITKAEKQKNIHKQLDKRNNKRKNNKHNSRRYKKKG